jgi:Peptidase family M23
LTKCPDSHHVLRTTGTGGSIMRFLFLTKAFRCGLAAAALSLAGVIFGAAGALGQEAAAPDVPTLTPLLMDVLDAPYAVEGSDGQAHLVYELQIRNPTPLTIGLSRVAAIDPSSGREVLALDRADIESRFALGGSRSAMTGDLGPAQFGVLFLHVPFPNPGDVPARLAHRVEGTLEGTAQPVAVDGAGTPVVETAPPVLGAPLRGDNHIAADGCCDSIRHVRALLALNGRFRLAQRFAIDWERIDGEGRIFVGDPKAVESYHIYSQPVLAVADGTVASALDGLPDQVPGALPADLPLGAADGNSVILDIGGGAFVLYAHMKPGSVRVKTGDVVRAGDVIGEVGNSGNSQAPHLHLHVMDAADGLLANGLPYVFERFRVSGRAAGGTEDFDRAEATGTPMAVEAADGAVHERQLPMDLTIIDWLND